MNHPLVLRRAEYIRLFFLVMVIYMEIKAAKTEVRETIMRNLLLDKTRNLYFSERIIEALDTGLNYPITIIEAPMGYGKTTAVRERLKKMNSNVLWQRIYDNSTTGFWSAFCQLFQELDADRAQNLLQLGLPNDGVTLQEALKLIAEIDLQAQTVLVIDDYHLVNGTDVESFIKNLAVNELEHLHIVLTARFVELLSIDELSLKGYLYHITKETFELTPNDIAKYFKLCGISLKDKEAVQLHTITEGWISALYLMMLKYEESSQLIPAGNIYKLVENAIYNPFPDTIKDFLLSLCLFGSFTMTQAKHMCGNENAGAYLDEIMRKNAFVNFDDVTGTYQMHNIFTNFLIGLFEKRETAYRKDAYKKAGHWCRKTGQYFNAMNYFYLAEDFEELLCVIELDKANSIGNAQKELVIKYFADCPPEVKLHHPVALLVFAMALVTFNEMVMLQTTCEEFVSIVQGSDLDPERINSLMGELELLLSFRRYNDILGMSEHHKKAYALMREPSVFMDTKGSWTFGSPSVLYMFYRESGMLEQEVRDMYTAMPYYYRLTDGHGTGAEYLMEAEWHFNKGDFENADIAVHKALYAADSARQPNMVLCARFLQARLFLMKGDYASVIALYKKQHEEIVQNKLYYLIHSIDMCTGFVNACLRQSERFPEWLAVGEFGSSRLYFPARAFSNIIYGRVLLIKGEYTKLLGTAGHFIGMASVFPNLLANIYTTIYVAAVNEQLHRKGEALDALKQALEMATPDMVYMPFVENCDYIKPLLETLYYKGVYMEHISKILELYKPYQKALEQITHEYFTENKPKLTERETEIAQLAAEGFSNKGIGVRLYISENTVKTQLKSVFEKLGINSRSLLKQYLK